MNDGDVVLFNRQPSLHKMSIMAHHAKVPYVILSHAMLHYVMICHVMLCYVMMYYVSLCHFMSYFILLRNVISSYIMFFNFLLLCFCGVVWCYVVNIEASVMTFPFIDAINLIKNNLYSFILIWKGCLYGLYRFIYHLVQRMNQIFQFILLFFYFYE